jgi:hypothetical protein
MSPMIMDRPCISDKYAELNVQPLCTSLTRKYLQPEYRRIRLGMLQRGLYALHVGQMCFKFMIKEKQNFIFFKPRKPVSSCWCGR